MENANKIILPGLEKQLTWLKKQIVEPPKKIAVFGASSEIIADDLAKLYDADVTLVVENYDALMNAKLIIDDDSPVKVKIMDFEVTDFGKQELDLIFAQGSVSLINRNKILKEFRRILTDEGLICIGEMTKLRETVPAVIENLWINADIEAIFSKDLEQFYESRNFEIIDKIQLNYTLEKYYSESLDLLQNSVKNLTDKEKSYNKKLIKRIKHETNVYLKHGGEKYIGFTALLMKKKVI
ncbi:MAG: methyltransferase domain-containing protein [Melioribacteraceae bacterium]|nr:methyltransferase domain-containing protein [Melioribacteraceae bacterium]MCF8263570.1 methyltransferase domain-containing protein [Melioribacteraceae bacterium]MCF8431235.1 methyltransferase domain-containing protein [Melioribacteraceae bacterium]